ncbi:MAG: hypothetical protein ACHQAX_03080 [Gammaproteobacteria bacterium]
MKKTQAIEKYIELTELKDKDNTLTENVEALPNDKDNTLAVNIEALPVDKDNTLAVNIEALPIDKDNTLAENIEALRIKDEQWAKDIKELGIIAAISEFKGLAELLLYNIPDKSWPAVAQVIPDAEWKRLLPNVQALAAFLTYFIPENFSNIYSAIHKQLKSYLPNQETLAEFLQCFPKQAHLPVVIGALEKTDILGHLITDEISLVNFIKMLPDNDRIPFLQMLLTIKLEKAKSEPLNSSLITLFGYTRLAFAIQNMSQLLLILPHLAADRLICEMGSRIPSLKDFEKEKLKVELALINNQRTLLIWQFFANGFYNEYTRCYNTIPDVTLRIVRCLSRIPVTARSESFIFWKTEKEDWRIDISNLVKTLRDSTNTMTSDEIKNSLRKIAVQIPAKENQAIMRVFFCINELQNHAMEKRSAPSNHTLS